VQFWGEEAIVIQPRRKEQARVGGGGIGHVQVDLEKVSRLMNLERVEIR